MGEALMTMRATMVVVAAAAFAIDALYVKLEELLEPEHRTRASTRVGRIVETLKIRAQARQAKCEMAEVDPRTLRPTGRTRPFSRRGSPVAAASDRQVACLEREQLLLA